MKKSSRFLYFSIIFAGFCLAAILRMSNYSFVFQNITGHLNFIDPDCFYQLRRLVYFLANFPQTLHFDPLADWPAGSFVDWPDAFIYLIGVPLKLMGVRDFRSLEIGSCFMMIFYGLVCCFAIFRLAKRLIPDSSIALLVFFLSTMNFLLIRFSCLGQLDHHIFEAIYPPVVLLLSLKAFQDFSKGSSVFLGLLLSLALMTSSSSIFIVGVFFAIYGFILGKKENFKLYFLTVGLTFASLLPAAVLNLMAFGRFQMMEHPSFFHIGLVLVLALFAYLVARFKSQAPAILLGFFALFLIGYALNWPSLLMQPLAQGFEYVFGRSGVLQNVSEASPIFLNYNQVQLNFIHLNFGYFVYLLPLAWVFGLFYKKFSVQERVLFLSLTMLSAPGIFQKRFAHIMLGLFLVFVGWCLWKTLEAFKRWKFRIGPLLIFTLFCLAIFPTLQFGFAPSGTPRDLVDLNATKFFLERLKPEEKSDLIVWDRLALKRKVTEGIWANPNLGHMLNYMTGYGVLTNSFYHWDSFDKDFKWRSIESDYDFVQALKENKIRFYILADDFRFFQLQYRLRNLDPKSFVENKVIDGQMATVFNIPELEKKVWVRRLIREETFPDSEKLFQVKFNTDHFYNYLKAYRFTALP
ncbi:MAG: hypothetical protein J0L93_04690 [Deltaproteobacteria bacterium]|nr:hypothetical protein [Deltaproteobacteria bacterium]